MNSFIITNIYIFLIVIYFSKPFHSLNHGGMLGDHILKQFKRDNSSNPIRETFIYIVQIYNKLVVSNAS